MNEFERRIQRLLNPLRTRLTQWWQHRAEQRASLRHEATVRAQRAATRMHEFAESDRGKRAASALHDMRESEAAKRAATALHDLRETPAAKRAEGALSDLRQREPVKKAEEGARRVLHDLRTGGGTGGTGGTGSGSAS